MNSTSMRRVLFALTIVGTLFIRADAQSEALQLHVASGGNDAWSGLLATPNSAGTDGPLATITGARDAIRKGRADVAGGGVEVNIHGGTYFVTEPVVFGPADSGSETAPITYRAASGEDAVIHSGRAITGWRKEGTFWVADIPAVRDGTWSFSQFWVNGERRTPARTPNADNPAGDFPEGDDLFYAVGPVMEKKPGSDKEERSATRFYYQPGDLEDWDSLQDAIVVVYHSWETALLRPKSIDTEKHIIEFTGPTNWGFGRWRADQRYHIEHLFEGLDQPGEWFLNRKEGRLYYMPLPGEDMTRATAVAPVAKQLLRIEGEPAAGKFVEHLRFEGLKFHYTEFAVKPTGHSDGQAAFSVPAAVEAVGARNVVFDRCDIGHTGGYGLWLRTGCQDNQVLQSEIHDLGAGGVRIGEGGSPASDNEAAERNVVDNCFIHDGGRVFRGAIGAWIGRSSYNRLSHNEISDFRYTGISVGWSWGYAETSAHHNIIEYNHVHHIAQGKLSDTGGIYTLGVSPGTIIRNNIFHDILSNPRLSGGWGIYFDEGSTDIVAENNLVYNTRTGTLHQHYGRDNRVVNNIFAFSHHGQLIRSREEEHNSFFFHRNIVYFNNNQLLGSTWKNGNFDLENNLYWSTADEVALYDDMDFAGRSLEAWQAEGHDRQSVIADPLFVNAEAGDFRLKDDSPAWALGFKPFDYSEAGLYGDPAWVTRPGKIARVPFTPPAKPEARCIADGYEDTPVGSVASGARSNEEGAGRIRVSDATAASGVRSLKFSDAPGLKVSYNPHLIYAPNLRNGTAHGEFAIRLEPGAVFYHEWRDNRSPYQVGPSLWFRDGKLMVGGKSIADIPADTWVKISIACPLGKLAEGTYDLTVSLPGSDPLRFGNLACGTSTFRRLDWFGFVSNAIETVAVFIDDVKVETK
ncbi:MAG: right-handed parallel beta-helix repeat-containing protein [Candidatus Hydrogenedentes bacterium]|nr:right-handed parallel beta-helix repeat-containing protein [Candidatus Hydrogenedentota bacterium]